MFRKSAINEHEPGTLTTRGTLQPKLISDELRVKDGERFLEEQKDADSD